LPDLDKAFTSIDQNSDGNISFAELVIAYNLLREFKRLDVDAKDGITGIELNELYDWPEV